MFGMKEYILCAAIWFDDGKEHVHQPKNINTGLVFCGHRHHCIFPQTKMLASERRKLNIKEIQGFITNTNRFVDRTEAGQIAFEANQTKKLCSTLFSEDLY